MVRTTLIATASAVLAVVASAQAQSAAPATLGAPKTVVQMDTGKLKGDPSMLAWSADGTELYLQSIERDRYKNVKGMSQFVIAIDKGSSKGTDQPPEWAKNYWTWKSGQVSPAAPAMRITVETRQETKRATSVPTGGDLARGGGDGAGRAGGSTSTADVAGLADQSQTTTIYTLKLKGESLGEWANEAVVPGVNFGWAPAPMRALALTKREGGPVVLLDENGQKHDLAGPKSALLPAFSPDGKRFAWLEKVDRKRIDIVIAEVVAK